MPDISMCRGDNCPLKEDCYRYTAEPDEFMQSYFATPPFKGDECDRFLDIWSDNLLSEPMDVDEFIKVLEDI